MEEELKQWSNSDTVKPLQSEHNKVLKEEDKQIYIYQTIDIIIFERDLTVSRTECQTDSFANDSMHTQTCFS